VKALVFGALLLAAVHASGQTRERHGAGDAFVGEGVSIVWAVLRGVNEDRTQVRLRVSADTSGYTHFAVFGIDPFSKDEALFAAPGAAVSPVTVRISRARFARLPRTEVRFFSSERDLAAGKPALVIFYLGVPDTTPEFESEATLTRYLEGERK
jgi:hypothetical protein